MFKKYRWVLSGDSFRSRKTEGLFAAGNGNHVSHAVFSLRILFVTIVFSVLIWVSTFNVGKCACVLVRRVFVLEISCQLEPTVKALTASVIAGSNSVNLAVILTFLPGSGIVKVHVTLCSKGFTEISPPV